MLTLLNKMMIFPVTLVMVGASFVGARSAEVNTAQLRAPSSAKPLLPQRPGTEPGPQVPSSTKHGAYSGPTPISYPANLDAARTGKLISTQEALSRIRLDNAHIVGQGLKLQTINLVRWSDVAREPGTGGLVLMFISPNRMVYEVKTTFDSYTHRGSTWSSGTRTFVIDAESGVSFYSGIQGHLTHSDHQDRLRQLHASGII